MRKLTAREYGKIGGTIVSEKYGKEFYQYIGAMGGNVVADHYPSEHYQEIGKRGGEILKATKGIDYYAKIGRKGGLNSKHPMANPVPVITKEYIMARMEVNDSGCWVWTGKKTNLGYGVVRYSKNGKQINPFAHRLAYEEWKGEIPKGLHIDHLCSNRLCVNPEHLEAISFAENVWRGRLRKRGLPDNARRFVEATETVA